MRLKVLLILGTITVNAVALDATKCASRLLSPRSETAAIYDGVDTVYIFGGQLYVDGDFILYDEVQAYNIASDTLEDLGHLPRTAYGGSVWLDLRNDGHILYLRGYGTFVWRIKTEDMSAVFLAEWHGNEALYTATLDPNGYKIMAFGGLDDNRLIYQLNLETGEQGKIGELPMPSELAVGIHVLERETTYLFGGKMGTWEPILLKFVCLSNSHNTKYSYKKPFDYHNQV